VSQRSRTPASRLSDPRLLTQQQQRREQAAARAGAYIERWFDAPLDLRRLQRAEQALREALEPE
jgi:hypothetical protein